MEEIEKLLHVAFNGQTEQEVDVAITALGLESIPFSGIHARGYPPNCFNCTV